MNNDKTAEYHEYANSDELTKVDGLLQSAAASIDTGKYEDAIRDFEHIIGMTRDIFGENIELMELTRKIKEIQGQLEQIERNSGNR